MSEELAARCEAATGPDRELDAEITRWAYRCAGANVPDDFVFIDPSEYTGSLDAAFWLVPEHYRLGTLTELESAGPRWAAKLFNRGKPGGLPCCGGASAALALCAASIRARLADTGRN